MKKRLTVNVDAELIPSAKRYARERGVTLSSLVEESLRELARDDRRAGWRAPARRSSARRRHVLGGALGWLS